MTRTFLVAHGDPDRRFQLGRGFTTRGCRVRLAADGPRALAMAIAQPPDLVVAHLSLPGLDGMQLSKALRSREDLIRVPVILLSEPDEALGRRKALKEDIEDVLVEPQDPGELYLRAQRALRRSFKQPVTFVTALRGKLHQFGVASVLGLLELDRKSGQLTITHSDGRQASLWLLDGNVMRANLASTSGAEVVYELARWDQGAFAFTEGPVDGVDDIRLPTSMLILEAARRVDEGL
jgi:DNA-binding response OmpR family regulator